MQMHNIVAVVLPPAAVPSDVLREVFFTVEIPPSSELQKRHNAGAMGSASRENSLKAVQVPGVFSRQSQSCIKRFTGAPLSVTTSSLYMLLYSALV